MPEPRLIALDFETTGSVPGYPNEPWQIGYCTLSLDPTTPTPISAIDGAWLRVSRDRPFNRHAPGRYAQLRDVLEVSPTLLDLWSTSLEPLFSGAILIAHNIGTERTLLTRTFPLHALGPWLDTLTLARLAWPGLPSYALEDLIPSLGLLSTLTSLCPHWAPHDARYDAVAAALLLHHLLSQPGWSSLSLNDLLIITP